MNARNIPLVILESRGKTCVLKSSNCIYRGEMYNPKGMVDRADALRPHLIQFDAVKGGALAMALFVGFHYQESGFSNEGSIFFFMN